MQNRNQSNKITTVFSLGPLSADNYVHPYFWRRLTGAHATMLQNSFDAYNRATWASEACQSACGEGLDTEVDRATWRAGNVDDGYDDAQDCNWVAEDPAAR